MLMNRHSIVMLSVVQYSLYRHLVRRTLAGTCKTVSYVCATTSTNSHNRGLIEDCCSGINGFVGSACVVTFALEVVAYGFRWYVASHAFREGHQFAKAAPVHVIMAEAGCMERWEGGHQVGLRR